MPGCDRISELPESLLSHILSFLPTKESVKTSVLSTRWKDLWLCVPVLDLNCFDSPYGEEQVFLSFIDRFLDSIPKSRLVKFNVKRRDMAILGFGARIGEVINRGIQYVDVESSYCYLQDDIKVNDFIEFMPLNLCTCKTLVSLKLSSSGLLEPDYVSLPCLKFMHLRKVCWHFDFNLEKLLSGCPVLEELTLVRTMDDKLTRVRSKSLKRFYVLRVNDYFDGPVWESTLEIDAPGLECMILQEDQFDRIVVKNLSSLVMVDLDIKFSIKAGEFFDPEDVSKRKEIREFLTGISSVKHMTLSKKTIEALILYSRVGVVPKFNNLSRLQVTLPCSLFQFVQDFLHSCPNLKHLIMHNVVHRDASGAFELMKVPQSFLRTLKYVEIRGLFGWNEHQWKMAIYFLLNAQVLKKLVVGLVIYSQRYSSELEICEELNKLAKRSRSCSVVLDCEIGYWQSCGKLTKVLSISVGREREREKSLMCQ